MSETWTVKRCLDWTNEYLGGKGIEKPRVSAEWMLSSILGLSRTQLYMSFDRPLLPEELDRMHRSVVRRAKGEPLQYITGDTQFRIIDVACEPGVLIPRPETEMLVEEVLAFIDRDVFGETDGTSRRERAALPWNAEVEAARRAEEAAAAEKARQDAAESEDDGPKPDGDGLSADRPDDDVDGFEGEVDAKGSEPRCARILEVGCGTGCISLSFAAERPGRVRCIATDIEPRAVALACRNRDALGIGAEVVDFREGNLVSPLDRQTEWGTFDVLVSNPPYIPTSVMKQLPQEVAAFEPELALEGGEDGLDIFRRLVNAAPSMVRPGGLLACELHETALDVAADICRQAGFENVRIVSDLAGRPRIILATVPEAAVLAARERFARRA